MKKAFLFLLLSGTCSAIAPTKFEVGAFPLAKGSASQYQVKLPNPASAGDAIVIGCTWGSATNKVSAITDDAGDVYTLGKVVAHAANGQSLGIYYSTGTIAGARVVTVTWTSNTTFNQCTGMAINNIATGNTPVDATCGQVTSGSTLGCGSGLTSTDGTMNVMFVASDGSYPNAMVNFAAGTGWQAFANDSNDIWAAQYKYQPTAGQISSTMTATSSINSVITAGIALKTAAGGGTTSGIHVQSVVHMNLNVPQSLAGKTSFVLDNPCIPSNNVNLMVGSYHTSGSIALNSMTSDPPNVWVSTTNVAGSNKIGQVYAVNSVCNSTGTTTITLSASPGATSEAFTVSLYQISGADTAPLDTVCSRAQSITQTSGTVSNMPSCTTANPNELLVANIQEDRQTVTSATPGYSDMYDLGGLYASFDAMQDGGFQHYLAASAGPVNVSWGYSYYEGGAGIGSNSAMATAWKQATAAPASATIETISGNAVVSGVTKL